MSILPHNVASEAYRLGRHACSTPPSCYVLHHDKLLGMNKIFTPLSGSDRELHRWLDVKGSGLSGHRQPIRSHFLVFPDGKEPNQVIPLPKTYYKEISHNRKMKYQLRTCQRPPQTLIKARSIPYCWWAGSTGDDDVLSSLRMQPEQYLIRLQGIAEAYAPLRLRFDRPYQPHLVMQSGVLSDRAMPKSWGDLYLDLVPGSTFHIELKLTRISESASHGNVL